MGCPATTPVRDYARLHALVRSAPMPPDPAARMEWFVDRAWPLLAPTPPGVSWIGFYTLSAAGDCLLLGPRRDRPACSPIGLHGVCGQCLSAHRPIVVRDVATLGSNYIACDPRDKAEVVIPLLEPDGACRAVLDADSHGVGAFADRDAIELTRALELAGLSTPLGHAPEIVHL